MVVKEDEDFWILITLKDRTPGSLRVSFEDCEEGFFIDLVSSVVDLRGAVDIVASRTVENHALDRVFLVGSDIIVHHVNYMISSDSVLHEDLVGMGNICLVSVVPVVFWTSDEDGPVVLNWCSGISSEWCSSGKGFHLNVFNSIYN